MKEIKCKYCGSRETVKKGIRRLRRGKKQIFLCKNCKKRFSEGLSRKRYNAKLILDAVCYFNQGYNYEEVCNLICRKYKANISKSSLGEWIKEYQLGYLGIKDKISRKYGFELVVGRMFRHSGLIYNFKFHKGKLKEFGKFEGLKNFIFEISKGIDNNIFDSGNSRCSEIKENVGVNVKVFDSKLNKILGNALKIVKENKQRHNLIENFMLSCDRDTMAVEVPVWYWDKMQNKGICGHIDVLQVKNGKIWILDYKPNAEQENVDKVVSQLYNYAIGLCFRSKTNLRDIKCGWFDENKMFVFDAEEVKIE